MTAADDDAVMHSTSDSQWVMMLHALARVKMLVVLLMSEYKSVRCPNGFLVTFYARTTHDCSDM